MLFFLSDFLPVPILTLSRDKPHACPTIPYGRQRLDQWSLNLNRKKGEKMSLNSKKLFDQALKVFKVYKS